jgi:hypothetical protein
VRNVTITLDEETARWARIEAARRDTSVSRLVGELLRRSMLEGRSYDLAMRSYLSRPAVVVNRDRSRPTRDEVHERSGLR